MSNIFDNHNRVRLSWSQQISEKDKAAIQTYPWKDQVELMQSIDQDVRDAYVKNLREHRENSETYRDEDNNLRISAAQCRNLDSVLEQVAREVLKEWSGIPNYAES